MTFFRDRLARSAHNIEVTLFEFEQEIAHEVLEAHR
jgi:hypothetical protein